jgi:hypothetical protein
MAKKNRLSRALVRARKKRGWSTYQASNRMHCVLPNTLRTLEGLNPDREPAGEDCKLKTVLDIVECYWPDVTLEDFAGRALLFDVEARDDFAFERLKYSNTG